MYIVYINAILLFKWLHKMTTSYIPDTLDGKVERDGLGHEACGEDAQRHAHAA